MFVALVEGDISVYQSVQMERLDWVAVNAEKGGTA
jgi:hypothetical protein